MRSVKTTTLFCSALAGAFILFGAEIPAHAVTYDWSFTSVDSLHSGSGTLEIDGPGLPANIVHFSGTLGGNTIIDVLPPGTFATSDNILYGLSPDVALSFWGVSFSVSESGSTHNWNIWYQGGAQPYRLYDVFTLENQFDGNFIVTEQVSATPLPAALPLFATGLSALGLVARRKKRKARA